MGGCEDPVDVLRRWESSGGTWRVVGRRGDTLTVSLCTCDGGEEMSRLVSGDPALLAYAGERRDEDGP